MKTTRHNWTHTKGRECTSLSSQTSSNKSVIHWELQSVSLSFGWPICTCLQVIWSRRRSTVFSSKRFTVSTQPSHNWSHNLTIRNSFRRYTISGRRNRITISFMMPKTISTKMIYRRLLWIWVIGRRIISCWSRAKRKIRGRRKTKKGRSRTCP